MEGIKRVLRDEPTLIVDAVRMTLLAVVLIGLNLSDEAVLGITVAVGSILTVISRGLVTPTVKVEEAVVDEMQKRGA